MLKVEKCLRKIIFHPQNKSLRSPPIPETTFNFFYLFSKFQFLLKKNPFLKLKIFFTLCMDSLKQLAEQKLGHVSATTFSAGNTKGGSITVPLTSCLIG
jgi:hypothetical protein